MAVTVANQKELDLYEGKDSQLRFNFAVKIAKAWFNILKVLKISHSALKSDLDGFTLVGEYVGSIEN